MKGSTMNRRLSRWPLVALTVSAMGTLAACSSGSTGASASSAASPAAASSSASTPAGQAAATGGSSSGKHYRIALFTQVNVPVAFTEFDGFKAGFIKQAGLKPGDVTWINKDANSDNSKCGTIARQLASQNLDGIAVIGTPCIVAMATADQKTPIFALGMGDPVQTKVANSINAPGKNVTGSWRGANFAAPVITELTKLKPKVNSLGLVYDGGNDSMAIWTKQLIAAGKKDGINVQATAVTTTSQVGAAARALAPKVDVLMVGPDGLVGGAVPAVASAAVQAHKLMITSGLTSAKAIPGVQADIGQSYTVMGQLGAKAAVQVLVHGKNPGTVPFQAVHNYVWTIYKNAFDQAKLSLPASITKNAIYVK